MNNSQISYRSDYIPNMGYRLSNPLLEKPNIKYRQISNKIEPLPPEEPLPQPMNTPLYKTFYDGRATSQENRDMLYKIANNIFKKL